MNVEEIADRFVDKIASDAFEMIMVEVRKEGARVSAPEREAIEVGIAAGITSTLENLEKIGLIKTNE